MAHGQVTTFYEWVAEVEVAELTRMATTIDRWRHEVLAFFDTRATNAATASANAAINHRRVARGFRNVAHYAPDQISADQGDQVSILRGGDASMRPGSRRGPARRSSIEVWDVRSACETMSHPRRTVSTSTLPRGH
jgi:hypothetical protein